MLTKIRFLISFLLLLPSLPANAQALVTAKARTAMNTFTLVQVNTIQVCSGSTSCNMTVSSTGAGHVGFITVTNDSGNADYLTAVGAGGTFVVPAGCQTANITAGATSCAYTLSTTAGVTTLPLTLSATSTYRVRFWEYSFSGGSASIDGACASSYAGSSSTTQAVQPLTLGGSNDVILQWITTSSTVSSVSGAYTTNFQNTASLAMADTENTITVTGTWTLGSSGTAVVAGCAVK